MKNRFVKKVLFFVVVMLGILVAQAQNEASPYGEPLRRSIWDKEPEPKPDNATSPFGGNLQRAAPLQQNSTLAGDPPAFDTNATDGVPIDGGLGFLLVAGVGYGVRRMNRHADKKKKSNDLVK